MEPGTIEKKIAKLPDYSILLLDQYLDSLLENNKQNFTVAEPEVKYNTVANKAGSGNWKTLIEKFKMLAPNAQIDAEKEIEKLLAIANAGSEPEPVKPRAKFGELKGFVTYMAEDFDAPLEEFKDYM